MRPVIASMGSLGDIQPFVAVALELRSHGHNPLVAFPPNYSGIVKDCRLDFISIGPDLQEMERNLAKTVITTPGLGKSAEQMHSLFAPFAAAIPHYVRDLRNACHDADVLISVADLVAARLVFEMTGIPFVSIQIAHFRRKHSQAFKQVIGELLTPFLEELGLPPISNPEISDLDSPQLALYALSRHIVPPPPDWPSHYHMVGFFFHDNEKWQPDPAVEKFMAAGEPPVVITFGSTVHSDPQKTTDLLLDAIGRVGCRAIIQQGWSGLGRGKLPSNVHAVDFASYKWLFPRAACVVHHGGAGTSAWTFCTGALSVFVPHLSDQPLWAKAASELGCSGAPIPYAELTAEALAEAITATLSTPSYRQATTALSKKVQAEHGVKKARQLIEQMVQSNPAA